MIHKQKECYQTEIAKNNAYFLPKIAGNFACEVSDVYKLVPSGAGLPATLLDLYYLVLCCGL